MKLHQLINIVLIISLSSCLEELPVVTERPSVQLVVEGSISNETSIHTVRLSSVSTLNGLSVNSVLGQGALVEIREIDGPTYVLSEVVPSIYQTLTGQLIPENGKSYQLFIRIANGEEYLSSIQEIPEPVLISDMDIILNDRIVENENGTPFQVVTHDVDIEVENSNDGQFFRVTSEGWAEVGVQVGDCNGPPPGPRRCWALRNPIVPRDLVLATNQGLGSENYKLSAVSIPFDFKTEYVVTVKTNSMSSSNYLFWTKIEDQLNRSGGIFDRPFAPIIGNILNTNGSNVALGYFHAYTVSERSLCFDRSNVVAFQSLFPFGGCNQSCIDVWFPAVAEYVPDILCN